MGTLLSYPQGATRAPRFCPSGHPAPPRGGGLKSLRSLPPIDNPPSNLVQIYYMTKYYHDYSVIISDLI